MNDLLGFLHRHLRMESDKNIDKEHVIVDKEDWQQFRISDLYKQEQQISDLKAENVKLRVCGTCEWWWRLERDDQFQRCLNTDSENYDKALSKTGTCPLWECWK